MNQRNDIISILGVPMAAVNMDDAISRMETWVRRGERHYVTVTGVHGIMESQRDPELLDIHRRAGMCVPDGMPTVFIGRFFRHRRMRRVYGPDLMLEVMRRSAKSGHTHYFFGGKEGVAESLRDRLQERFPGVKVAGVFSPPFRPMTEDEEAALARELERLRPDFLWVGLSTPKQERWMAAHVGKLNVKVMVGVGAAFDFHAGLLRQAPGWMQRCSLEWLFRLTVEPKRLWRRYLFNNPAFMCRFFGQALGLTSYSSPYSNGRSKT